MSTYQAWADVRQDGMLAESSRNGLGSVAGGFNSGLASGQEFA
jgi:hypothetical protein